MTAPKVIQQPTEPEVVSPEAAAAAMVRQAVTLSGELQLPVLEVLQLLREAIPPRHETVDSDLYVPPANVYQALVNVAREVGPVRKLRESAGGGGDGKYKFRGIDDVMNAVHESMARNGVLPVPHDDMVEDELPPTADRPWTFDIVPRGQNNTPWRHHLLRTRWVLLGPNGTSLEVPILSEALDNQDKGLGKARSYGMKDLLLRILTLPTDDPNADNEGTSIPEAAGYSATTRGSSSGGRGRQRGRQGGGSPAQDTPPDPDAEARAAGFENEAHRMACHNEVTAMRRELPEGNREAVREAHAREFDKRWPLTADELGDFREFVEGFLPPPADDELPDQPESHDANPEDTMGPEPGSAEEAGIELDDRP